MESLTNDDLNNVEALIDSMFSGSFVPELHATFDRMLQQHGALSLSLSMIESGSSPQIQQFGLMVLTSGLRSKSVDITENTFILLCRKITEKLNTLESSVPIVKKMYQALVHLCLAHIEHLRYPIRFMVCFFTGGFFDGMDTEFQLSDEKVQQCIGIGISDGRPIYKSIQFLITLVEEINSGEFDAQTKATLKHLLKADDNVVCAVLETAMILHTSERLAIQAMNCAQLWLSVIIGNRGVTEHISLLLLIYNGMEKCENLYLTGLDCLINLFEDGGAGLDTGHGTVVMLDFHVSHIARLLEPTFRSLIAKHTVAVTFQKRWDDFEQKEPLNKIALLLQTLSNIEMQHLIDRAGQAILDTNNVETSSVLTCQLLSLMPLCLSLLGGYPDQETISELGLQIWSNLIDTLSTPPTDHSPNRTAVLTKLQDEFLRSAFIKCRYPGNLPGIFAPSNTESFAAWYTFRAQLGDAFLASYGEARFRNWFVQLQQQMMTQFEHFLDGGGFGRYWQHDEAILYVLGSISEQVVAEASHDGRQSQEFATNIFYSLSKLAKCALLEFWSTPLTSKSTPQLSDWILIAAALSVCQQYLPFFVRLYAFTDETWDQSHANTLIEFVFTCLSQLSRLAVAWVGPQSLLAVAVKAAKGVIASMPGRIVKVSDRLILLLEVGLGDCHEAGRCDAAGLAHCIGSLLALSLAGRETGQTADRIVSSQLDRLQGQLKRMVVAADGGGIVAKSQIAADNSLASTNTVKSAPNHPLSFFTELFSGIRSVLEAAETDKKACREAANDLLVVVAKTLLRVVILLQQTVEHTLPDLLLMDELVELLRAGFRTLFPTSSATFSISLDILTHLKILLIRAISSAHTSHLHGCLRAVRLIVESSTSDTLLYISGYKTSQVLFHNAVNRVDEMLLQVAKDALTMDNFSACRRLEHPLPPLLMIHQAQKITDEIEAFATFFTTYLEWWTSKVDSMRGNEIIDDLLVPHNPMLHWKVYLSVGLTGVCLPEWRTVERCLGLVRRLLLADQTRKPGECLLTEDAVLQIHSSLLVRITKGVSVNRLLNQLALTYLQLSNYWPVTPSRQLAQLCALLNCVDTIAESDIQWAQNHPDFVFAVQGAIIPATAVERLQFARTILQSAASGDMVKTAIKNFLIACRDAR